MNQLIDQKSYNTIRDLVFRHSGISLADGKVELVSNRLTRRMRELGMAPDFRQYIQEHLRGGQNAEEMVQLVDAISTNVTSFFRESEHFDLTETAVSRWLGEGRTRLRFWSAACSTGQEPYSLAMVLRSLLGDRYLDMKILATDISTRALTLAMDGRYDKKLVEPVPRPMQRNYLTALPDDQVRVTSDLQALITFRHFNLSEFPYPMSGPLDIIFCRNVMIYFERELRDQIVAQFVRLLRPGGYLLVGHSESLVGCSSELKLVQPSSYIKL